MVNQYKLNISGEHRRQWVGFDGAPVVSWANASYEVAKINSSFGFSYLNNQLGAQQINEFKLGYAYRFVIANAHQLIPGIHLGFQNSALDGTKLDPIDGSDPNIISSNQAAYAFVMGLGIQYRFRHLIFGFGANQITGEKLALTDQNAVSTITLVPHLYTVASYDFHFGNLIRIMPKIFYKTDLNINQVDVGLWVGFDNLSKAFQRINIGAVYRTGDAIVVSTDLQFKWFTIGYAYDITTTEIRNYSEGSHQGSIKIHLFKKKDEANNFSGL